MLHVADLVRQVLVLFLLVSGALLGVLLGSLVLHRLIRDLAARRRQMLVARYRPAIDAILQRGPEPEAIDRLCRAPASHRPILAALLLAPLRAARGEIVTHARQAAAALGLIDHWLAALRDRHWWRRAEAAGALGLVEERAALGAIIGALDDEHEEVRAAAVEAAGLVGSPRAIPALLGRLADGTRHQRARVVEALRVLGPPVTPALVELARVRPDQTRLVADVLGLIGTVAAIEPLLQWCGDSRTDVRAAALAALASIGLDDRSYYYALRALGDPDPHVRAMGARALGRSSRQEAASYLAERLDDEWVAAAHAAAALRRLGAAGRVALEARAHDQGQAGDLARQMLWERQPIAVGA